MGIYALYAPSSQTFPGIRVKKMEIGIRKEKKKEGQTESLTFLSRIGSHSGLELGNEHLGPLLKLRQ